MGVLRKTLVLLLVASSAFAQIGGKKVRADSLMSFVPAGPILVADTMEFMKYTVWDSIPAPPTMTGGKTALWFQGNLGMFLKRGSSVVRVDSGHGGGGGDVDTTFIHNKNVAQDDSINVLRANKVPYTGATNNLALGNHQLSLTDTIKQGALSKVYYYGTTSGGNSQIDIGSLVGAELTTINLNGNVTIDGAPLHPLDTTSISNRLDSLEAKRVKVAMTDGNIAYYSGTSPNDSLKNATFQSPLQFSNGTATWLRQWPLTADGLGAKLAGTVSNPTGYNGYFWGIMNGVYGLYLMGNAQLAADNIWAGRNTFNKSIKVAWNNYGGYTYLSNFWWPDSAEPSLLEPPEGWNGADNVYKFPTPSNQVENVASREWTIGSGHTWAGMQVFDSLSGFNRKLFVGFHGVVPGGVGGKTGQIEFYQPAVGDSVPTTYLRPWNYAEEDNGEPGFPFYTKPIIYLPSLGGRSSGVLADRYWVLSNAGTSYDSAIAANRIGGASIDSVRRKGTWLEFSNHTLGGNGHWYAKKDTTSSGGTADSSIFETRYRADSTFAKRGWKYVDNANSNFAVGESTFSFLTSGYSNQAIGWLALKKVTSGHGNTAIGDWALERVTTGYDNIAIGEEVLRYNISGADNVGIGWQTLYEGTTLSENVAIGDFAGKKVTGSAGVFIGQDAGSNVTSGNANVIVGHSAGYALTTGGSNTIIGKEADALVGTEVEGSAFGYAAKIGGLGATAIGARSRADYDSSFALGYAVVADRKKHIDIGKSKDTLHIRTALTRVDSNAHFLSNVTVDGEVHADGDVYTNGSYHGDGSQLTGTKGGLIYRVNLQAQDGEAPTKIANSERNYTGETMSISRNSTGDYTLTFSDTISTDPAAELQVFAQIQWATAANTYVLIYSVSETEIRLLTYYNDALADLDWYRLSLRIYKDPE